MRGLEAPIDIAEDEARDLLLGELSRTEYQQAKPTLIDEVAQAIGQWLVDLLSGQTGDAPPLIPFLIALGVVAVVVVIAVLVYGVPRRNRGAAVLGGLFGEDESRSAAELRDAARAAAARADWLTAIAEAYRATARGLAERELVRTLPGTTAREFAHLAAIPFPAERDELDAAARAFDDVRYLGRPGGRAEYEAVLALEARLRASRPHLPGTVDAATAGAGR